MEEGALKERFGELQNIISVSSYKLTPRSFLFYFSSYSFAKTLLVRKSGSLCIGKQILQMSIAGSLHE